MIDKSEIIKEIDKTEGEIESLLTKINTYDGILTLLSFLEIMDNELNNVGRKIIQTQQFRDLILNTLLKDCALAKFAIYSAIGHLLSCSNGRQELTQVPLFTTLFSTIGINDPNIQNWFVKHYDPNKDHFIEITIQTSTNIIGTRFIIFENIFNMEHRIQIDFAMDYFLKYYHKKALESHLHSGNIIKLSEDKKLLVYSELSSTDILLESGFHPRQHTAGPSVFPMYKTELNKITEDGLISTELKVDAPKQQIAHDLEHNAYFKEFIDIPQFSELFKQQIGIDLKEFRDVTLALKKLVKSRSTAVIIIPKQRLITKIKKDSGCNKQSIQKILNYFTHKKGDKFPEKGILFTGTEYIFSWSTIGYFGRYPLEKMYYEYVNANSIGIEFEKECRKMLQDGFCDVFPDRLVVHRQMLSDEISKELWKKIKKKGEFDVIAVKGKFIIVLECKSELPRLKKSESQINTLLKFDQELWYKSSWISQNIVEFHEILKSSGFSIPSDVNRILPILVTSFINPRHEKSVSFTIKEVSDIVSKLYETDQETINITLDSQISVSLPILNIINKK